MSRRLPLMCVLCSLVLACDPEDSTSREDEEMGTNTTDMAEDLVERQDMPEAMSDQGGDMGDEEMGEVDMASSDLGEVDMAEQGFPGQCDDACKMQDLTISFGDQTRSLSHAVYGLSAPEEEGAPWTIYLEAHEGEVAKCPEGTSSPDYTMILSGLPIFEDEMPVTKEALPDLSSVLFDFKNDFIKEAPFFIRADRVTVSARALSVCVDCVGMPAPADEDGFVALTVEIDYPDVNVSGNLYAIHCDIMDRGPVMP